MTVNLMDRLRAGPPLLATFSLIASTEIVELLAKAGFDAVILDTEHGPIGPEALNYLIPAARAAGIAPLVRVRANEASLIGAALDTGAAGVLVPQIESCAAAQRAISAARFAPLGQRGVNPYVRAAEFDAKREWFTRANDEAAVILMIEGLGGIQALPEILGLPGLDGILIGPFDLSQAVGRPGEVEHPDVITRIENVIAAGKSAGIATAIFAPAPPLAKRWLSLGARMVAVGFDTAMALQGFHAVVQNVRGGVFPQ